MIQFFRKIRHRLIDQEKIGKYLTYALGEILLVVIGILIALQINNANMERQHNKELNSYILKISDNIKDDLIQLEEKQIRRDTLRARADKAAKLLIRNDYSDIRTLIRAGNCFGEFYFIPNTSGFEALKSSQFLGDIKDKQIDSLITDYYSKFFVLHLYLYVSIIAFQSYSIIAGHIR